eukprot:TRINITY_DN10585_c0_g1_i4.p1 TRINITY_DN10585_c0_g1~~TRINITY_DN10585_c0_g1_i4.p1  ORF type:complete len:439 (+),score=69.59 TRINITY_DN10585_c0_g1_i4:40-1356(+)
MDVAANISLVGLSLTSLCLYLAQIKPTGENNKKESSSDESQSKLLTLQRIYLPAHLLALFSDWLQGPYVFQLYKYHGHGDKEIAVMFLAGYLSSCVFGTLTGPMADKYGRRCLGQVFCIICGLSCLTKISPNFYVLLFGRILSGVSTSCLYSVFESWYVSEHKSQDLPTADISSTLALITTANSVLAITAGLFSDFLVQGLSLGPLAPFIVAIPCLASGLILISLKWTENYGSKTSVLELYKEGAKIIWSNWPIMQIGIIQGLVESSMFIFVYLWTPTLSSGQEKIPLGKIFASFMLSIMIGSLIFRILVKSATAQRILFLATLVFLSSTLVASQFASSSDSLSKYICYVAFLFIEISLGMYFPSIGTLRSNLVPGSHRSTIINLFRIPLNLLTVATLLAIKSGVVEDRRLVFGITSVFLTGACLVTYSIKVEEKKNK